MDNAEFKFDADKTDDNNYEKNTDRIVISLTLSGCPDKEQPPANPKLKSFSATIHGKKNDDTDEAEMEKRIIQIR